jgi:hypothetical protein
MGAGIKNGSRLEAQRRVKAGIRAAEKKWTEIGTARRKGCGIEIEIPEGPFAGLFAIKAEDAGLLLVGGSEVPIWQRGAFCSSKPWVVGKARWSESGKMVILGLPASGRYGAVQIIGNAICAHFLRGSRDPVAVLVPPDPKPLDKAPILQVV